MICFVLVGKKKAEKEGKAKGMKEVSKGNPAKHLQLKLLTSVGTEHKICQMKGCSHPKKQNILSYVSALCSLQKMTSLS